MTAVAAGVARFLAVESCGQCSPCKLDGITLSNSLARLGSTAGRHPRSRRRPPPADHRRRPVALLPRHPAAGRRGQHRRSTSPTSSRPTPPLKLPPCEPELIAELIDINGGVALLDERHRQKQWDWSFNKRDSGTVPVEKYQAVAPPWLAGEDYEPVVLRDRPDSEFLRFSGVDPVSIGAGAVRRVGNGGRKAPGDPRSDHAPSRHPRRDPLGRP